MIRMGPDRDRIFTLLEDGRITVDEAEMLIHALGNSGGATSFATPPPPPPPVEPMSARLNDVEPRRLQIQIHQPGGSKNVNVSLPLSLIKFAARLMPKEARNDLAVAGVDLEDVLNQVLSGDLTTGEVLSVVTEEDGITTHIDIRAV